MHDGGQHPLFHLIIHIIFINVIKKISSNARKYCSSAENSYPNCEVVTIKLNDRLQEESEGKKVLINPRRACAARVTVVGLFVCVCVCVCVCVSTLILELQATRRPISDTSGFSTT